MTTTAIKFIEQNPRSTAKEAGLTNAEANALVGQGKLIVAGDRQTGKKGRPPREYVVPSYDMSEDTVTHVAVETAIQRVKAHKAYERISNDAMRAANAGNHDLVAELRAMRRETFVVPPPLPSGADYALAGIQQVGAELPPEPIEDNDA